jgi:glucose-6-phosphate isomerase
MIRIGSFVDDVAVPAEKGFISQKKFSELLGLAQEATAWALTSACRPNCTITLSQLSAWTWGGLLYFFEMATAFEGELLNVNAFDQPGVESYKNYMYYKLRKPGIPEKIAQEIEKHPVKSDVGFIL